MRSLMSSTLRVGVRLGSLLAGLAVLALIIAWMSGWFETKIPPGEVEQAPQTATREWVTVEVMRVPETVDAVGTVEPHRKTAVASQILATILAINVDAGDRVKKGQVLITLDSRELKSQKAEAEAQVAAAMSDVDTRRRDYGRYRMMFADKAVTAEEFDRVKGAYDVSEAQLRRTREQVARMDVQLSYTQIRAPVSGLVTNRFADPGDLAAPSKPLLSVHDPHDLELQASVRETLSGAVRLEMKLPVRIDAVGRTVEGTVREIVPRAQETSRSVLVKLALPADQTGGLYTGMFGRVAIPIGSTRAVVVPPDVVLRIGQLELVEVVDSAGHVERRFVRTGRRFGERIEILSGLSGGERVLRQRK